QNAAWWTLRRGLRVRGRSRHLDEDEPIDVERTNRGGPEDGKVTAVRYDSERGVQRAGRRCSRRDGGQVDPSDTDHWVVIRGRLRRGSVTTAWLNHRQIVPTLPLTGYRGSLVAARQEDIVVKELDGHPGLPGEEEHDSLVRHTDRIGQGDPVRINGRPSPGG